MGKRVFTEEQKKKRALTGKMWRIAKQQNDPVWRQKERARTSVS